MDEVQNKAWYLSKGVWGAAVAILAGVAGIFGYNVGAEEQGVAVDLLVGAGAVVGGAVALYGRVRAKQSIGKQA